MERGTQHSGWMWLPLLLGVVRESLRCESRSDPHPLGRRDPSTTVRHAIRVTPTGPWLGPVVALALAWALAGCGQRSAAKLDAPMIEAMSRAGAQAAAARDAQALCAQVTDAAEIKIVLVRFSGSDVQTLDKPRYCQMVEAAYADLPEEVNIRTAVDLQSIDIAADGQSAEVVAQVSEEYDLGGRAMRQSSRQSSTVVLVGGQPRYSRISARLAAQ